ncbi:MAG: ABC transporter ATP-binding protein [Candidatus Bathyarchaeia archaeon]
MPEYAIETSELTKCFGDHVAVDRLNLRVERGSIHGLLGPNGAGKTTTLNMLAGVTRPTRGTVKILGHDLASEPSKVKASIGYLPDEPAVYEVLTVREFLRLIGRAYGVQKGVLSKRIDEYLEWFGLKSVEETFCGALSHGLKQRVVICSVLIHDPEVILLDEPLYGLDPASSRLFKELLRTKIKEGCAILVSTHILELVERFCDRVTVLNMGRAVASGSLKELRAEAGLGEDASLEDAFLAVTRR